MLGLDALPLRIECFDISNLMGTNTVASMVVFEGGAPKKSDYRRFNIRSTQEGMPDDFARDGGGARAPAGALGVRAGPQPQRPQAQRVLRDAAEPDRHRRRRRASSSAGVRALHGFVDRGRRRSISLAKRIEEVFIPGRHEPLVLAHDTPELQLLQRVRDEAHRFAITHHRSRRDRQMTESVLDGLPGVGPKRKRALLKHFGSPEAVLDASREELEAVPGLPSKTARRRLRLPQPHVGLTARTAPMTAASTMRA